MSQTPDDLADALEAAGLASFFAECTEAHRREYLKWIGDAKRPETRKTRIREAMRMLSKKKAGETARSNKAH